MLGPSKPDVATIHTLVGREDELHELDGCLSELLDGTGNIVTIGGPAGIGKTHLSQELANRASLQKIAVLQTHCYEEPAAPAYWPWTQLLENYHAVNPDNTDSYLTEDDRVQLAAISPVFGPPESMVSTDLSASIIQPRFKQFDAVSRFWTSAARHGPLILIIDDLHWCDEPSLKLLEFIVRDVVAAPLMIVLTYRDDEIARRHPLSDTLGEIARQTSLHRLRLSGLPYDNCAELIQQIFRRNTPSKQLNLLFERSEGNPFYLLELVRFLEPQKTHNKQSGSGAIRVPDGVRAVIGKRLNRTSPACERLLVVAAVVGRTFILPVVARLLTSMSEEAIWDALEEASAAHLIEPVVDHPDSYRFVHMLIRETLYDELLPSRRMHLHRRCAELLGSSLSTLNETGIVQLAYHYAEAAPLGDGVLAIQFSDQAAQRALVRKAYEEAVRLYSRALDLFQYVSDPSEQYYCELELALGGVQTKAGEVLKALTTYHDTVQRASQSNFQRIIADAAIGYEDASWRRGLSGENAVALLDQALIALGSPASDNSSQVSQLLAALGRAHGFCGNVAEADRLNSEAISLARKLDDPATLIHALRVGIADQWRPERLDIRLQAAKEAIALAESTDNSLAQTVDCYGWYIFDLIELGDITETENQMEHYSQFAEELGEPFYQYVHMTCKACLLLVSGRFTEFERLVEHIYDSGRRMQGLEADGPYSLQMFSLRREQGRLAELAPVIAHIVNSTPNASTWRPGLALLYMELNDIENARQQFEIIAKHEFTDLPTDSMHCCCLVFLAEICAFLKDGSRGKTLYSMLLPYAGHNVVVGAAICFFGSADRYLGMLASTFADSSLAEKHFISAMEFEQQFGAIPWLAHSRCQYAGLLLQQGRAEDHQLADELIDLALKTSQSLQMPTLTASLQSLRIKPDITLNKNTNPDELTSRENEVLQLLALGASNRDIGEKLFISPNTVANHVRNILAKTHTANRTEAAAYAAKHHLLDEPPPPSVQ